MRRVYKVFVMWLIALAIPVQGMAAVSMAHCPAEHHTGIPGAPDRPAVGPSAGAKLDTAEAHAMHQHATADPFASSEHQEDATTADSGHSGHGMLKCCSATISMAAVMAPGLVARLTLRSPAPLHLQERLDRGVTPDGLDRPPKFHLA